MTEVKFTTPVIVTAFLLPLGQAADLVAFAGAYGDSIYALHFNPSNGRLTRAGIAAETHNPSFLAVTPDGRFLYAANETGAADDTVSAYAIDKKSVRLMPLNQASSHGSAPCHLAIDATSKWLAVANYASGSVAILPILPDGKLGPAAAVDQHHGSSLNKARQAGPHAHSVVFSPDNRYLLSADLGVDKIFVYRFNATTGALSPADPPFASVTPGSGPRHLIFHPSGLAVYMVNDMADNLAVFRYDPASGSLNDAQIIDALPPAASPNAGAEIAIHASSSTLYVSSRGRDAITRFAIDPDRYLLTALEATPMIGKAPRFFTFDPSGAFAIVANQDSDSLAVFRVHPHTGELRPIAPLVTGIKQPSCVVFVK